MFRSSLILALTATALTACSGADASPARFAGPTPSLPCSLPYGTQAALLSPAPGSLVVPAGDTPIVIAASRDLPKAVSVVALDRSGAVAARRRLERVPAPRTPVAGTVYYRSAGLALRPGQRYTIALDNLAQNGCAPFAPLTGEARFST
jgi:hypothetical protein